MEELDTMDLPIGRTTRRKRSKHHVNISLNLFINGKRINKIIR